jgi:hypothetical protein
VLSTSVDSRFAMIGVGQPGQQGGPTQQNLELGVGSSAGTGGTALGYHASAGSDSVAVGTNAFAAGPNDTAVGFGAMVNATNGTALGSGATVNGVGGTALGANAVVNANGGTAIGAGATVAAGATNAIAIGNGSVATRPNSISFGGPTVGDRTLTGIAAGTGPNDAANFGQVQKAYSGVAMAFALTATQPTLATGEQSLSAGAGVFQDQWGFSLKYEARPSDRWFIGAGVTVGSDNDWGGNAGIGFKW